MSNSEPPVFDPKARDQLLSAVEADEETATLAAKQEGNGYPQLTLPTPVMPPARPTKLGGLMVETQGQVQGATGQAGEPVRPTKLGGLLVETQGQGQGATGLAGATAGEGDANGLVTGHNGLIQASSVMPALPQRYCAGMDAACADGKFSDSFHEQEREEMVALYVSGYTKLAVSCAAKLMDCVSHFSIETLTIDKRTITLAQNFGSTEESLRELTKAREIWGQMGKYALVAGKDGFEYLKEEITAPICTKSFEGVCKKIRENIKNRLIILEQSAVRLVEERHEDMAEISVSALSDLSAEFAEQIRGLNDEIKIFWEFKLGTISEEKKAALINKCLEPAQIRLAKYKEEVAKPITEDAAMPTEEHEPRTERFARPAIPTIPPEEYECIGEEGTAVEKTDNGVEEMPSAVAAIEPAFITHTDNEPKAEMGTSFALPMAQKPQEDAVLPPEVAALAAEDPMKIHAQQLEQLRQQYTEVHSANEVLNEKTNLRYVGPVIVVTDERGNKTTYPLIFQPLTIGEHFSNNIHLDATVPHEGRQAGLPFVASISTCNGGAILRWIDGALRSEDRSMIDRTFTALRHKQNVFLDRHTITFEENHCFTSMALEHSLNRSINNLVRVAFVDEGSSLDERLAAFGQIEELAKKGVLNEGSLAVRILPEITNLVDQLALWKPEDSRMETAPSGDEQRLIFAKRLISRNSGIIKNQVELGNRIHSEAMRRLQYCVAVFERSVKTPPLGLLGRLKVKYFNNSSAAAAVRKWNAAHEEGVTAGLLQVARLMESGLLSGQEVEEALSGCAEINLKRIYGNYEAKERADEHYHERLSDVLQLRRIALDDRTTVEDMRVLFQEIKCGEVFGEDEIRDVNLRLRAQFDQGSSLEEFVRSLIILKARETYISAVQKDNPEDELRQLNGMLERKLVSLGELAMLVPSCDEAQVQAQFEHMGKRVEYYREQNERQVAIESGRLALVKEAADLVEKKRIETLGKARKFVETLGAAQKNGRLDALVAVADLWRDEGVRAEMVELENGNRPMVVDGKVLQSDVAGQMVATWEQVRNVYAQVARNLAIVKVNEMQEGKAVLYNYMVLESMVKKGVLSAEEFNLVELKKIKDEQVLKGKMKEKYGKWVEQARAQRFDDLTMLRELRGAVVAAAMVDPGSEPGMTVDGLGMTRSAMGAAEIPFAEQAFQLVCEEKMKVISQNIGTRRAYVKVLLTTLKRLGFEWEKHLTADQFALLQ